MSLSQEKTAAIYEIFSGIQGEGMLVGLRQLFVRFHACNLSCTYCDTPSSRGSRPESCAVETHAGTRQVAHHPNPFTTRMLLDFLRTLQHDYPHHSVSLTGGEPLLCAAFLTDFLPLLHAEGFRSMLETNGTLAGALAALSVLPHYIAMDIKLPSVSGGAPLWDEHAAFLDVLLERIHRDAPEMPLPQRVQVKVVFGQHSLAEIEHAALLIAARDVNLPYILQPVTPHPGGPPAPGAATVLEAQRLAAQHLREVRVIPQTHVMLGQW